VGRLHFVKAEETLLKNVIRTVTAIVIHGRRVHFVLYRRSRYCAVRDVTSPKCFIVCGEGARAVVPKPCSVTHAGNIKVNIVTTQGAKSCPRSHVSVAANSQKFHHHFHRRPTLDPTLIYAPYIMTVSEPIVIKLKLVLLRFVNNSCTEFHENPSDGVAVISGFHRGANEILALL